MGHVEQEGTVHELVCDSHDCDAVSVLIDMLRRGVSLTNPLIDHGHALSRWRGDARHLVGVEPSGAEEP